MTAFLISACLPSVVLLIYIYKKDKTEKEPFSLLLKLFVLGAVSCFPIAMVETGFSSAYSAFFNEEGLRYQIFENFFVAGMCEEVGKFLVLYFVTHKNKNFNCLFDGVIYSVVVALGFATLENIMYVSEYGFTTAVVRAFTAVPGHMFDGVIMGYFYTLWHLNKNLSIVEKHYAQMGYIDRIIKSGTDSGTYLALALIVPILTHGMYDFLASYQNVAAILLFAAFLISLYIYCFAKINKISKQDQHEINIIAATLNRKYPYLYPRIQQAMRMQQMQYNPFNQRYYNPYSNQNNYNYHYQSDNNYTYR